MASGGLGAILTTIFERPRFLRRVADDRSLPELCAALLDAEAEGVTSQLANAALGKFAGLSPVDKIAFFTHLNDALDVDAGRVAALAGAYSQSRTPADFAALMDAAEPPRQALFRRLNQAPGATAELVRMRADLLGLLSAHPDLARTDRDLGHLLASWFNRGFLVLRQITWDSPASILEKIIAYEAVHAIRNWDDLRRRIQPPDRRCFAFFHPAMPDEPLIFVEVALMRGIPGAIRQVLADGRTPIAADAADTAVFYSISNCQPGLAGISFGNSLIKTVVRELARELPGLGRFVTLSPIPGFTRWLAEQGALGRTNDPDALRRLAAHFLIDIKSGTGLPRDPVARFHLGNGAMVRAIHAGADNSTNGQAQSRGVMVNYLYDMARISRHLRAYEDGAEVACAPDLRAAARQGAALLEL